MYYGNNNTQIGTHQQITSVQSVANSAQSNATNALNIANSKAKMFILAYTGTGNYGADNPCTITVSSPIQILILLGWRSTSYSFIVPTDNTVNTVLLDLLTTSYQQYSGFSSNHMTINTTYCRTNSNKTMVEWYSAQDSNQQLNMYGSTYYYIGLG